MSLHLMIEVIERITLKIEVIVMSIFVFDSHAF